VAYEAVHKCRSPACSDEWHETYERLACDHASYSIPEVKVVAQRAAPLGRQIVPLILSTFRLDESQGAAALLSILSLRDACKKDPISASTIPAFLDTWGSHPSPFEYSPCSTISTVSLSAALTQIS
jgi:hypothetical protein